MISLVPVSEVLAASNGVKPPATIDTADESATAYWANRLSVSPAELFDAIQTVGPSVAAIRRHLHK